MEQNRVIPKIFKKGKEQHQAEQHVQEHGDIDLECWPRNMERLNTVGFNLYEQENEAGEVSGGQILKKVFERHPLKH